MTNLIFVLESMRLHLRLLVVVTVAALLCGAGLSVLQSSRAAETSAYVAEVTFYVDGHESQEVNEYNYELNEDYLASDVRRIIVSGKVAGAVRQEYGPEVTIKTPYWVNRETKNNVYSHYIYAEVSAPTPELALAAAQAVADKTIVQIEEQLSVTNVSVTEGPILKTVTGMAADYGVDELDEGALKQNAQLVNPKTVFVVGFCGFALAVLIAVGRDLAAKRVRSENDVVRLFGIPVADALDRGELDEPESYYRLAAILGSVARKEDLGSLGICALGVPGGAQTVAKQVEPLAEGFDVACAVDLLQADSAMLGLSKADAVLLVVGEGAGGGEDLNRASGLLNVADLPCVGALYVTGGEARSKAA